MSVELKEMSNGTTSHVAVYLFMWWTWQCRTDGVKTYVNVCDTFIEYFAFSIFADFSHPQNTAKNA